MIYKLLIFCLSILLSNSTFGQGLDFGLGVGASGYYGDLSREEFIKDATDVNLALEGEFTYQFNRWIALTASFNYLQIDASDEHHADPNVQYRNLSFESNVFEGGLMGEYHFLGNADMESNIFISPYVTAGIAGFKFNPKTELDGVTYELQPLGTEGQGLEGFDDKYSLTSLSIPFGLGIKFRIRHPLSVKFDIIGRYTFTDYLDDVSGNYVDKDLLGETYGPTSYMLSDRRESPSYEGNRGRSSADDKYFTYMITFVYNIYSSGRRGIFCPTVERPQF